MSTGSRSSWARGITHVWSVVSLPDDHGLPSQTRYNKPISFGRSLNNCPSSKNSRISKEQSVLNNGIKANTVLNLFSRISTNLTLKPTSRPTLILKRGMMKDWSQEENT
jgi:hypothetical protein